MADPSGITVHVWVPDVWDNVTLPVTPETSVEELKRRVLGETVGGGANIEAYEVKFRGALVDDESRSLAEIGARDRAPLIVLARHRRPVT